MNSNIVRLMRSDVAELYKGFRCAHNEFISTTFSLYLKHSPVTLLSCLFFVFFYNRSESYAPLSLVSNTIALSSSAAMLFNTSAAVGFSSSSILACSPSTLPKPTLFGAEILSFEATQVYNLTQKVGLGLYSNHGAVNVQGASFCNVSITYTHPGQNDTINMRVYLPSSGWNGRMQAIGGNGWQAGMNTVSLAGMTAAMGEGYTSLSTDAGLGSSIAPDWALVSEGNVNYNLLQDLASTSLNDMSVIGKDLINSYYGSGPVYSYWNGCSQGGRQGMMLAQRFPEAFDGIVASAPAINWSEIFVGGFWSNVVMNTQGIFPRPCEMQAITAAAVAACDGDDGVVDGVIADPESCTFDPTSLVGTSIRCDDTNSNITISAGAATLTKAMWDGPQRSDNTSLSPGFLRGTILSSSDQSSGGSLALTTCSDNGTCVAAPSVLVTPWITKFVLRNDSADLTTLTRQNFEDIFHASKNQYSSIIDTIDPDLSAFRARGGKILGYHGLVSPVFLKPYPYS